MYPLHVSTCNSAEMIHFEVLSRIYILNNLLECILSDWPLMIRLATEVQILDDVDVRIRTLVARTHSVASS